MDGRKQIANAVHYESSLRNGEDDRVRRQIVRAYIPKGPRGPHARFEMQIYRMMGKNSKYFTHAQELDLDGLKALTMILEFWAYLSMAGELDPLLQHEDIQKVFVSDCSPASVFRAFLDVQRVQGEVLRWSAWHLDEVVYTVHKVVEEFQNKTLESSQVSQFGKSLLKHDVGVAASADIYAETPLAPRLIVKLQTKPRSQPIPAQANSMMSSDIGPPAKKPRLEEKSNSQPEQAQAKSNMSMSFGTPPASKIWKDFPHYTQSKTSFQSSSLTRTKRPVNADNGRIAWTQPSKNHNPPRQVRRDIYEISDDEQDSAEQGKDISKVRLYQSKFFPQSSFPG